MFTRKLTNREISEWFCIRFIKRTGWNVI